MAKYVWVNDRKVWFDDDTLTPGQMIVEARKAFFGGSPSPYNRNDEGMASQYYGRTPEMGDSDTKGPGFFGSFDPQLDPTTGMEERGVKPIPSIPAVDVERARAFKESITPNSVRGERLRPIGDQWADQTIEDVENRDAMISGKYLIAPEDQQFTVPEIQPPVPQRNPMRETVERFMKSNDTARPISRYGTTAVPGAADQRDMMHEVAAEENPLPGAGTRAPLTPEGPAAKIASGSIDVARGIAKFPGTVVGAAEAGLDYIAPGLGSMRKEIRSKLDPVDFVWKKVSGGDDTVGESFDSAALEAKKTYDSHPEVAAAAQRASQVEPGFMGALEHYIGNPFKGKTPDPAAAILEVAGQAPQMAAMAATGAIGKAGGFAGRAASFMVPSSLETLETLDAVKEYEKSTGVKVDPSLRDTIALGKGLLAGALEYYGFESATGKLYERLSPGAKAALVKRMGVWGKSMGIAIPGESTAEFGQTVIGNVAEVLAGIDNGKSLFAGAPEAAVLGGLVGGAMAGGIGIVNGEHKNSAVDEELDKIGAEALQQTLAKAKAATANLAKVVPAQPVEGLPMPAEPTVAAAISTSPVPSPVVPQPNAPQLAQEAPTAPPIAEPVPPQQPPVEAPVEPPTAPEPPPPQAPAEPEMLLLKNADGGMTPVKPSGQVDEKLMLVIGENGVPEAARMVDLYRPDGSPLVPPQPVAQPAVPPATVLNSGQSVPIQEQSIPIQEEPASAPTPEVAEQPAVTTEPAPSRGPETIEQLVAASGIVPLAEAPQQLAQFKIGDLVSLPAAKKASPLIGFAMREGQPVAILRRGDGVLFTNASPQQPTQQQIDLYEKKRNRREKDTTALAQTGNETVPVIKEPAPIPDTSPVIKTSEPITPPVSQVITPPPAVIAFNELYDRAKGLISGKTEVAPADFDALGADPKLMGAVLRALTTDGYLKKSGGNLVVTTPQAKPEAKKAPEPKPEPAVVEETEAKEPKVDDRRYRKLVDAIVDPEAKDKPVTVTRVQSILNTTTEIATAMIKQMESEGIVSKYQVDIKGRKVQKTAAQVNSARMRAVRKAAASQAATTPQISPPVALGAPQTEGAPLTPSPAPKAVKTPPSAIPETAVPEPPPVVRPKPGDYVRWTQDGKVHTGLVKARDKDSYSILDAESEKIVEKFDVQLKVVGNQKEGITSDPGEETPAETPKPKEDAEPKAVEAKRGGRPVKRNQAKVDSLTKAAAEAKAKQDGAGPGEEREEILPGENIRRIPENSLPGIPGEKTGTIPGNTPILENKQRESEDSQLSRTESEDSPAPTAPAAAVAPPPVSAEDVKPKTAASPTAPVTSKNVDVSIGNIVAFRLPNGERESGEVKGHGKNGGIKIDVADVDSPNGIKQLIVPESDIEVVLIESAIVINQAIDEAKGIVEADDATETATAAKPSPVATQAIKKSDLLPKETANLIAGIAEGTANDKNTPFLKKIIDNLRALTSRTRAQNGALFALKGAPARVAIQLRTMFVRNPQLLADLQTYIAADNDAKILELAKQESPILEGVFNSLKSKAKDQANPISAFLKPLLGPAGVRSIPVAALYKPANRDAAPIPLLGVRDNTLLDDYRKMSPSGAGGPLGVSVAADRSTILVSEDDNFYLDTDMDTIRQVLDEPRMTFGDVAERGLFRVATESSTAAKMALGAEGRADISKGVEAHPVAIVHDTTGTQYVALVGLDGTINLGNAGLIDYLTRRRAKFYFSPSGNMVYAQITEDGKKRIIGAFEASGYERTLTGFRIPTELEGAIIREMIGEETGVEQPDPKPSAYDRKFGDNVDKQKAGAKTSTEPAAAAVYDIFAARNATDPLADYDEVMRIVDAFQEVFGHNLEILPIMNTQMAQALYNAGKISQSILDHALGTSEMGTGLFTYADGRVTLFIHHINSGSKYPTRSLINTLVHEVIGHHGFSRFMDDPFAFMAEVFAQNRDAILNDQKMIDYYGHYWRNVPMAPGSDKMLDHMPDAKEFAWRKLDERLANGEPAVEVAVRAVTDEWLSHQVEAIVAKRVASRLRNEASAFRHMPKWYEKLIVQIRNFLNKVLGNTKVGRKLGLYGGGGMRFVDVEQLLDSKEWKTGRKNYHDVIKRIEAIFDSKGGFTPDQAKKYINVNRRVTSGTFFRMMDEQGLSELSRALMSLPRQSLAAPDVRAGLQQWGISDQVIKDSGLDEYLREHERLGWMFTPDHYMYAMSGRPNGMAALLGDADITPDYERKIVTRSILDATEAQRKGPSELETREAEIAAEKGLGEEHSRVKERMAEANGIQPSRPFYEKALQQYYDIKQSLAQAFPYLYTTKNSLDSATNDILRLYKSADSFAAGRAGNMLREITAGLNSEEEAILGEIIVLRDIVNELEVEGENNIYDGVAIQFGITDLASARALLLIKESAIAEKAPKVIEAIARREAAMIAFVETMVEAGILPETHKDPKTYFRRQTLQYYRMSDSAKRSWASRQKLLATQHGSMKKRVGAKVGQDDVVRGIQILIDGHNAKVRAGGKPTKEETAAYNLAKQAISEIQADFNTNYREAEFEHLAAAFHTLRLIELTKTLKTLIDDGPRIHDLAKQANKLHAYGGKENMVMVESLLNEARELPKNKKGNERRAEIREILQVTDPFYDSRRKFAMGKSMLANSLKHAQKDGRLHDVPGKFQHELEQLIKSAMTRSEMAEAEDEDSGGAYAEEWNNTMDIGGLFDLMQWLDVRYPGEFSGIGVIYQSLADKQMATKKAVEANGESFETADSIAKSHGIVDRLYDLVKPRSKNPTPEEKARRYEASVDLVSWSPDDKHIMYRVMTVGDRMLNNILQQIDTHKVENVDPEALELVLRKAKPGIALGPLREKWYIPRNIAKQLDEFGQREATEKGLTRAWETSISYWKLWKLHGPFSYGKYNLNNMVGDGDIVLGSYPGALDPKLLQQVLKDLNQFHGVFARKSTFKRTEAMRELEELVGEGVLNSGVTTSELVDLENELTLAINRKSDGIPERVRMAALFVGGKAGALATLRENVLRLAVHRYLTEQFRKTGTLPLGASNYKEIRLMAKAYADAEQKLRNAGKNGQANDLRKRFEKALINKVSRELLGDYGNISHAGQWIRRKLMPFWSWMEINAPRYWNLLRNSFIDPTREEMNATTLVTRLGLKGARTALRVASFAVKAHIVMAAVSMVNHFIFGDEEEELGSARSQMHLIVGRNADSTVRSLRVQGALSDVYGWVGLENPLEDFRALASGEVSVDEMIRYGVPKTIVNRLVNGLDPFSKGFFEGLSGVKYFPTAFREGPTFERQRRYTKSGMLEGFVNSVVGFPAPRIMEALTDTPARRKDPLDWFFTYRTDPAEQAFWDTKDLVQDWIQKTGKGRPAGNSSPSDKPASKALYNYRKAIQYEIPELADQWIVEYFKAGGTPKGMAASIQKSGPLDGINIQDRQEFFNSLSVANKKRVMTAIEWYEHQEKALQENAKKHPEYSEGLRQQLMEQRAQRRAPRIPRGANRANTYIPGLDEKYQ